MVNKIKEYLCRKRFKVKMLKNNRGFSLMELLVAVGILGILSAIAIPQFQDYREDTALTAAGASTRNALQAFNTCMAMKGDIDDCNTTTALKLEGCDKCVVNSAGTSPTSTYPVCVGYDTTAAGKKFQICYSITDTGTVNKSYGGAFKICQSQRQVGNAAKTWVAIKARAEGIKKCSKDGDCTSDRPANSAGATCGTSGTCWDAPKCQGKTSAGICQSAGTCSS